MADYSHDPFPGPNPRSSRILTGGEGDNVLSPPDIRDVDPVAEPEKSTPAKPAPPTSGQSVRFMTEFLDRP